MSGQLGGQVGVEEDGRLEGPAARHIADCVSSAPQHQERQAEVTDQTDTLRVTSQAEM